jgi:hypothetical protein
MIPFYGYSLGPCLWWSLFASEGLVCSLAGDENGCGCVVLSSDFLIYLVVRMVCLLIPVALSLSLTLIPKLACSA